MDFWKWAYENQYASKADLKEAVTLDDLAVTEFKQITGEDYVAK